MAGQQNPTLEAAKAGVLIFVVLIFLIVFASLFIKSVNEHGGEMSEEEVVKNLAPPGRVHIAPE